MEEGAHSSPSKGKETVREHLPKKGSQGVSEKSPLHGRPIENGGLGTAFPEMAPVELTERIIMGMKDL